MKIALYLGSFNPFHNGHLEVVKTALNDFKMDRVVIVPTMQNPWKKEKVLDITRRREIIENYILDFVLKIPHDEYFGFISPVKIDLIEKELVPPYYSYATLHALKNKYCNDKIFILCGEDTIKDIPNWMNGEYIIKDYDFLIVDRPDNSISSTYVRECVKQNKNIEGLVSDDVINLIKKYYK